MKWKKKSAQICIDEPLNNWSTSLKTYKINDSCLVVTTHDANAVERLVLNEKSPKSIKLNIAIGMKYLEFNKTKVKVGFNEKRIKPMFYQGPDEDDPERFIEVNGKYVVDKYPVTNCDFIRLMGDCVPKKASFEHLELKKQVERWIMRKRKYEKNLCVANDSAANDVYLLQALKYANMRSNRENLKPYYKFSESSKNAELILSKNSFTIQNRGFEPTEKKTVLVQMDTDYHFMMNGCSLLEEVMLKKWLHGVILAQK